MAEKVCGGPACDLLIQFDEGKLGYAVDGHEQVKAALCGADFGDIDIEVVASCGSAVT